VQLGDQAAGEPGAPPPVSPRPRERGTLEHAQQPFAEGFGSQAACPPKALTRRRIAAHESPRTTKVYDRTTDQVSLDEIVCTGPPSYGEVAFSAEAR